MPKNEVRFGVGTDQGQYSMVWRAWAQGEEVYLAPRGMANVVKLSVHSSGIWRWAWTKDSVLAREVPGDRASKKWSKPPPFVPGWSVGPVVMWPYAPVEGWGPDPLETTKDVHWLALPTKGRKVSVNLLMGDVGVLAARDLLEEKRMPLIAEFELRSGARVWVCKRDDPMTFDEKRGIAVVQARGVDPASIGYGGTAIIPSESNGAPLFVELRVPKRKDNTLERVVG